jgi:hypothetical protein
MGSSEVNDLAEKIAKLISAESRTSDLSSLRNSIDQISKRLEKLETSSIAAPAANVPNGHPSLDKFVIAEAIVDSLFAADQKEKTCSLEPTGKPCDHCSMCNSRGF